MNAARRTSNEDEARKGPATQHAQEKADKARSNAPKRSMLQRLSGAQNSDLDDQATDWQQQAHRVWVEQNPLRARALLYAMAFTVVALLIWSAFAEVDEVTRGVGKVIPSRQIQIVQSQDGGVIREIAIREGQLVAEGDLLVRLDQTRSESTLRENLVEKLALQIKAQRLSAVIQNAVFEPAADLQAAMPTIVAQERELYDSTRNELRLQREIALEQLSQRRDELEEVLARERQMGRSLELSQRELDVTQPMVASGAVSEVEILRLEREVNQLAGEQAQAQAQIARLRSAIVEAERRVDEVQVEFLNEAREELSRTLARIQALEEAGAGLSDRVAQTHLRAPVPGTIKQLYYNTIGGVVMPGDALVDIVPLDDTLLLEVRIQPRDIAFLVPGQAALVKFSAYDFVVHGGLDGEVEYIGADTVMDEEGNPFYKINVRTNEASLGPDKPIIPGMTVEVDILTGKKTILAYLMKPVLRARQYALSER